MEDSTATAPNQVDLSAPNDEICEAEALPQEVTALIASATGLGYSIVAHSELRQLLARSLGQRLRNRVASFVYQLISFNLPRVDRSELMQLFPSDLITEDTPTSLVFSALDCRSLKRLIGTLISDEYKFAVGATKGLKTKSERFIRVVAHIYPHFTVTCRGRSKQGPRRCSCKAILSWRRSTGKYTQ